MVNKSLIATVPKMKEKDKFNGKKIKYGIIIFK